MRLLVLATALTVLSGPAAVAQSTVQVGVGGTPGPGGMAIAPGPAGAQNGGIQNLTSQAGTLSSGCTIPSPTFKVFSSNQPGTTNNTPAPLPPTTLSGC